MSENGTKTLKDLTKPILERLYLEELLTEKQIADRYQTSQVTIGRRRSKWGIPTVGKTGRITKSLPALTEEQRELILGSLLGDGTMNGSSPKTARFVEGHSLKQRGYTDWKADLLGEFVSQRYEATKTDKETGKTYKAWLFATRTTTHLREFFDLFYCTGVRVFPSNMVDWMTPRTLAIWYMDDGNISNKFHPRITFGLDDLSRKRAFRALRALGLKPVLHEQGTTISIDFPGQTDQFFEMCAPHIPDCMAYKLPQESERRDQDRNAKKLTPEKARELFDGNMSLTAIAKLYGVGRSTVHRRIHQEGAPKRMGRPRQSYSLRAAEEALGNYDPGQYRKLSEVEKETWVSEVLEVLRKSPFPATPQWSSEEAQEDLKKLKRVQVPLVSEVINSHAWRGTICCQSFFPHRYKSSWRGTRTAYEAWHEDKRLRSAIKYQLEHGDPVKPNRVLRAVTMRCRTPGVFRPAIAKFLYQTYCPKGGLVWDPCAGWGGRLMGAAAAGVRYVGTDVEPETVEGNLKLAEALGYDAQVVQHPAQIFDVPQVDMVFTSPPYFNVEHYGESEDQSFRQFTGFDAWSEGFMRPVIERAFEALPSEGVLALNVADVRERKKVYPIPDRVVGLAKKVGFKHETTLGMPLARLNRAKERTTEPVLIFRKP